MVNIGNLFRYTGGAGTVSSDKGCNSRDNAGRSIRLHNGHNFNNNNKLMPMEIKIALVLRNFLAVPIVLINTIIILMGQIGIQLPEWAKMHPVYQNIFLIIGIFYLLVRVLIYGEILWEKHLDNVKKNKEIHNDPTNKKR